MRVKGEGVTEEMWPRWWPLRRRQDERAQLAFESEFLAQPAKNPRADGATVEDFVYKMLTEVLGTGDTAPLAVEAILTAGPTTLAPSKSSMNAPTGPTQDRCERAKTLDTNKGAAGNISTTDETRRPQGPDVTTQRERRPARAGRRSLSGRARDAGEQSPLCRPDAKAPVPERSG